MRIIFITGKHCLIITDPIKYDFWLKCVIIFGGLFTTTDISVGI